MDFFAIGTYISSLVTRKFGMHKLDDNHLSIRLRGSAGQSLGAFGVKAIASVVSILGACLIYFTIKKYNLNF